MNAYAQRLGDDTLAIFLFHGVTRPHGCAVRNYTRKHIEPDHFASILRALKAAGGRPVSMQDVLDHHDAGTPLPPRAFAITFDDGFHNNLDVAAPILAEEGIPATFYVTTDFVDRNRMGWIDRIEFAVEQHPTGRLRLPWGDREFSGDEARRVLLSEIRTRVKSDASMDADALATAIQVQLGVEPTFSSNHLLDRKLNWEEVARLAAGPGFIVAGHSHTHRILEYLDDESLEAEIATSIDLLAQRAGIRSPHYSYPEGQSYCYSDRVIDVLARHGVRCSPSAIDGVNAAGTSPFHLRRVMVT